MMKKLIRFISFLLIIGAPLLASAQQNLTPELMWKLGRVSDPRIAPDGKTVIYGVRYADVAADKTYNLLYKMDIKGGTPVQLTEREDNAVNGLWRPDGKKIGYMSGKSGDMELWEMNPDGTGKTQITHIKDGIDLFQYAPDMKHILYARDIQVDPTLQQRYPNLDLSKTKAMIFDSLNIRHWDTWNDGTYTHLFYASYNDGSVADNGTDIMKDQPYDSPLKPFGGPEQISWTPDGSSIAYTCKKMGGTEYMNTTNSDIYLYNINTGKEVDLTVANKGYDMTPVFSADGKYMAYLSMKTPGYESDKSRLMLMDMGTRNITDLSAGFDQVTDGLAWDANSKVIYFLSETNATIQVYAYNLDHKKNKPAIEQLTNGIQNYEELAVGKDGRKTVIVASQTTMNRPAELFTIDPEKKKDARLSFVNKTLLDGIKASRVQKRWIKATDGKQILTWVIYPPDFDSTKKYPTLLYTQGGPQAAVNQFYSFRWNFALMAANGYIIVAPNRRGLPSFGQAWNDEIAGDYGGQCMRDYNSAIDAVMKEPYVDDNRIGAVGASFGGYSIYWLAGHNLDKKFKVFIAHDGMFDMTSWYGSTEEMWFANHDQNGPYWKNPEDYKKFSPHEYVQNWNTPILIISNLKDFRVPFTQGLEAFTAAQEMHIPSRLLTFPDENHWVSKPQNSILWHHVFFDWLNKYIGK